MSRFSSGFTGIVIAASLTACASTETQTDVARAMCEKNIQCDNLLETIDACTTRVAATMPPSSCTSDELLACENAIDAEPCTAPGVRFPIECGVCD